MKLSAPDVLRRGFDNAVANWPLFLFRFAENVLNIILVVASILAIVVPMLVSAGLSHFDPSSADAADVVLQFLREHVMIIVYVFGVITVVSFVMIAIHSFVVAGIARVVVDADRTAAPTGTRDRFQRFTVERWMEGGRDAWWPVFWIYNIAYGLLGLIICIPLAVIAAAMLAAAFAQSAPGMIATGCIGLPIVIFIALICAIIGAVWSQKAIVVCIEQHRNATDALRTGWREARADLSRHFAVAFIMFVIAVGGSGAISMISLAFNVPTMPHGSGPMLNLVFLPARMVVTALSSLFGSAVALWSLASFAALSEKR